MVVVVLRMAAGLLLVARELALVVFRVSGLGANEGGAAVEEAVDAGMEKLSCEGAVLAGAAPKVKAGGAPAADGALAAEVCVCGTPKETTPVEGLEPKFIMIVSGNVSIY